MHHIEQVVWREIGHAFGWQCPNIQGYIEDHVELEDVKGFNLKSINGITTISVIGGKYGKRQETFCDLELSGDEMLERRKYTIRKKP